MNIAAIGTGLFINQPDKYKTAAAEGWGNLLDFPSPAQAAVYQHNQSDLEYLRAGQGFMDYTDDSRMGLAAEASRHRVSDGTSNTVLFGE